MIYIIALSFGWVISISIVMTDLARSLFDCSKPSDHLPSLQKPLKPIPN